jgi:hypothetical protein
MSEAVSAEVTDPKVIVPRAKFDTGAPDLPRVL